MKKNNLANALMVLAILAIFAFGLYFVADIKGWNTSSSDDNYMMDVVAQKGIANVERNAVSFRLEEGMKLEHGDIVQTQEGSQLTIGFQDVAIVSLASAEFKLSKEEGVTKIEIIQGHVLMSIDDTPFQFETKDHTFDVSNSIVSVQIQDGSSSISLFKGKIENEDVDLNTSDSLIVTQESTDIQQIDTSYYSDDFLNLLKKYDDLCISIQDIDEELQNRQELIENILINKNEDTEYIESSDTSDNESSADAIPNDTKKFVYIEIEAKTILNNRDKLEVGKDIYVPDDGIIVPLVKVEIEEKDTVMDILKKVCEVSGIPLEFSYFPIYESHYIESINNLYEFDCGQGSGWTYRVDGWKPNYGVSQYKLHGDEVITFSYTCDYGNDIQ